MSFGPNWEPGWWRHSSHRRKIELVERDVLKRVSARLRRKRMARDLFEVAAVLFGATGLAFLVIAGMMWGGLV